MPAHALLLFTLAALVFANACTSQAPSSAPRIEATVAVGLKGVVVDPRPDLSRAQFSAAGWRPDFTRRTVPLSEIQAGGPPRDGIPPLDHPKTVPMHEGARFLDPDEPVIVVEHGDEAAAYPLQIMLRHEVVNDTVGGEPVVVTYCPLCNTAIVFRRTLDGHVLDFGTTGNLRHSDLVMYDRQTES